MKKRTILLTILCTFAFVAYSFSQVETKRVRLNEFDSYTYTLKNGNSYTAYYEKKCDYVVRRDQLKYRIERNGSVVTSGSIDLGEKTRDLIDNNEIVISIYVKAGKPIFGIQKDLIFYFTPKI